MTKEEKRKCKTCGKIKTLTLFPKYTGTIWYRGSCKQCAAIRKRTVRPKYKLSIQNKDRRYYLNNKEKFDAKSRKQVIERDPKYIARYTLRLAVARGDVIKEPCQICDSVVSEAHHPDYSKALKVIWLCKKHHAEQHRKYK